MSDDDDDFFVQFEDEDGNTSAPMDRTTADFLTSTDPDPSQRSLDEAFARATRARILGPRIEGNLQYFDAVRADVTDPAVLTDLHDALRIREAEDYGHILTFGNLRLELWIGDQQLPQVEFIDGEILRWEKAWRGYANLAAPQLLQAWLRRHLIPTTP